MHETLYVYAFIEIFIRNGCILDSKLIINLLKLYKNITIFFYFRILIYKLNNLGNANSLPNQQSDQQVSHRMSKQPKKQDDAIHYRSSLIYARL